MREENYEIYFLDQSYTNALRTGQKEWQAEEKMRKNPTGKGERIIFAHIMVQLTIVCLSLRLKSTDENEDYQKFINSNEAIMYNISTL